MIEYLEVRNSNREIIGILDDFQSIIWETNYYSTGAFEVYLQAVPQYINVLQIGNYVTRPDDENIGIIENINVEYSEEFGKMIAASGRFAKSILDRRIIYNASGNTTGKLSISPVISSGLVETAVRKLVTDHIISSPQTARNISFITLGKLQGITKKIVDESGKNTQVQTSFGNLLEYTDEMLHSYELGAKMVFDRETLQLKYTVYEGKDRSRNNTQNNLPIIMSQEYDNFFSSKYEKNTTQIKNTALIGGEGEGADRFCTMIGTNAVGLNRREVWIDASAQSKTYELNGEQKQYTDDEYLALLKSAGTQTIADYQTTEIYDGELNINALTYKTDFNVGDIITVEDNELNIYINPRIIAVIENQNESGYSISISYGN